MLFKYNETLLHRKTQILIFLISFFNKNGTQYKDENDFEIIKETKSFKECSNYNSSIDIQLDTNIIELDETKQDDLKLIKYKLFMEGPLLAILQSNKSFFISNSSKIYYFLATFIFFLEDCKIIFNYFRLIKG